MTTLPSLALPARLRAPVLVFVSLSLAACAGDGGIGGDAFLSAAGTAEDDTGGDTRSDITASTIDPSDSLSTTMPDTTVADDTASETAGATASTGGDSGSSTTGEDPTSTTAGETSSSGSDGDQSSSSSSEGGGSSSSSSEGGQSSSSSTEGGSSSATGGCDIPNGIGNYDACLDAMNMPNSLMCGFAGATCINDGATPASVSVCSQTVCVDECDCPAAPATGDSVVTCDDIAGDDLQPECYLDCASGETCPDDMGCFAGLICVHDSGAGGDEYGACETGAECPLGDTCIVDDPDAVAFGVCSAQGCTVAADCPAAPATGDAVVFCEDITGSVNDCFLDCTFGETCPDGMQCIAGFICIWPV